MKKQKVYLVTIKGISGKIKRNPLLPSEFHLAKTMLNESDVESITIKKLTIKGLTQSSIDNQIACLF